MDWDRDLSGWPYAAQSSRVQCGPHKWHVQRVGQGPTCLLLHGAGATTHTWAALLPFLAARYHCIAIDLPGHGFTVSRSRQRRGLDAMAADITELLKKESLLPDVLLGHSAGAAVALRLAIQEPRTKAVIGINPALENFSGVAGWLFPILAKAMAANPLSAWAFSSGPNPRGRARRLIEGTGTVPTPEMLDRYARLISDKAHVDGALSMMAQWTLDGLVKDLPKLRCPVLFITGGRDKAVPPQVAKRAAAWMTDASVRQLPGLGHLAHESDPEEIFGVLERWCAISVRRYSDKDAR